MTFADFKGLPALACACKTTCDAARDEDMLARDKVYVLRCYLTMGGKEDTLRRGYFDGELKMRDEPSDDLAGWLGVTVEGGRVTKLHWSEDTIGEGEPLTGTIPAEIGALDGLTSLILDNNQICGHLPSEIGRLTAPSVDVRLQPSKLRKKPFFLSMSTKRHKSSSGRKTRSKGSVRPIRNAALNVGECVDGVLTFATSLYCILRSVYADVCVITCLQRNVLNVRHLPLLISSLFVLQVLMLILVLWTLRLYPLWKLGVPIGLRLQPAIIPIN